MAQSIKKATDKRPESIAKEKVANLTEQLNLDGDQQRTIFRAFVMDAKKKSSPAAIKSPKAASMKTNAKSLGLDATMKKTLTDDQYKKWLAMKKKQ